MAISLGLKTIKLIVMILNFSYFIGMGWLIMCKITMSTYKEQKNKTHMLFNKRVALSGPIKDLSGR